MISDKQNRFLVKLSDLLSEYNYSIAAQGYDLRIEELFHSNAYDKELVITSYADGIDSEDIDDFIRENKQDNNRAEEFVRDLVNLLHNHRLYLEVQDNELKMKDYQTCKVIGCFEEIKNLTGLNMRCLNE